MDNNTFEQHLLEVLKLHPAGLSEFELIKKLESGDQSGFKKGCLKNNLSLFQTHFFLFHTLYQLNEKLILKQGSKNHYRLQISPLRIQLIPQKKSNEASISSHDPLRDYYLDLDNLKKTSETAVNELLTTFWGRFVTNDERRNALEELELQDPVDWSTIKNQHRRLAMEHHPDRGGDEERLQAINAAMDVLARGPHHARNK